MRGNAALAARIARLEAQRKRSKRRLPRLAFFIHGDNGPEATVEGFSTFGGATVPRKPGEALPDALRRAWEHPEAGSALFAVYPPDEAPEEAPGQTAPWPEPEPQADPYSLAGIGRVDEKYRGYWRPEGERG